MATIDRSTLLAECERLVLRAVQLADQAGADMTAAWLVQALAAIEDEGGAREDEA